MPEDEEMGIAEQDANIAGSVPETIQEAPEQGSKWNWIGSPNRPEAQEHSDGISDLFDVGEDEDDASDLLDVDFERDILDAGEDGTLEDLVNVSNEDIIGAPPRPRMKRPVVRRPVPQRYVPPSSMGGL